jgi:hypothetical protein
MHPSGDCFSYSASDRFSNIIVSVKTVSELQQVRKQFAFLQAE